MADRIAVMAAGRVQQIATPVDLYRRPANLFVADFIGSSNRFAGRVDGGVFVSELLGKLPGAADAVAMEPAHLVVRPEDVRLMSPAEGSGTLRGRVIDVQFKGGLSHVAVDVAGALTPLLVSVPGAADVGRGDEVALEWSTAVVVSEELV